MVTYDPFSDAVMKDPWPFYAELRRESPVHYLERYDTWFLSRFEDIWTSTTHDLFSAARGVTPEMVLCKAPPPPVPVFTMLDRPRQQAYRKPLVPRYTRRAVAAARPRVRARVRELLAPVAERGHLDVYGDLADPLATQVIAEWIGLPADEAPALRRLVAAFFAREPGQVGTSPSNARAREELLLRLAAIVQARIDAGPDPRADDHIQTLLRTRVEGAPLGREAVTAAAFSLLVTGVEVVPLAVANTAFFLWQHPDQRRAVLDDPALVPHAFAESLRYDQPTNLLGRVVAREVDLGGQRLRPGQGVMFLWASGNRDEREFEGADVFDIGRRPRRTLSFGHGLHKCIGEHLGRLEGCVLLEELLAVAPAYEVRSAGVKRSYGEFLHGYDRMPIEFAPRALATGGASGEAG